MTNLICATCYNPFKARRRNALYCSPSCKQKAHRHRHGQNNKAFGEWADKTKPRHTCKHCGNGFWGSGKGRTPKFCSNSCRQSANIRKQHASFQFIKMMNGSALEWASYDCWMYLKQKGTGHIEEWANRIGWEYSYSAGCYWQSTRKLWLDHE